MSQLVIVPGTEVTMLFAGFNVDTHHLTLIGIIVFGVLGDVIGASAAYAIGYFGLHEVLARRGSPLHVDDEKIERASGWFERFGSPAVAVSRLHPGVPLSPALRGRRREDAVLALRLDGDARLDRLDDGWALVGKAVGHKWPQWKNHLDYVDYVVVALIVIGACLVAAADVPRAGTARGLTGR